MGRGRLVQAADHPLHHVVDVGEVTPHPALVEHPDRLTRQDRPGEQHRRHVRPAPGAVHREEAQARGRQAVEMAVGVGHQLVGLLGGGIQAHRMVHRLRLAEGQIAVAAIHRAAAGIHQVLHLLVAAALQHMAHRHQVALHVGAGILQGVAHAGLGRQVDQPVGPHGRQQRRQRRAIGQVELMKPPGARAAAGGCLGLQPLQARLFEGGVVVGIEIVDPHHLITTGQQPFAHARTDEAGRAGHENGHRRWRS